MTVENLIAQLLSILLSLVGVSCTVDGDVLYVPSLNHRFVVTLSCVDLVSISLWAFISVFALWVYANLNNINISRRKCVSASILSFIVFFIANIFRMFIEIFYVANVGASYTSYLLHWQAFEEQVGIGIMFTTFTILFAGFYFTLRRQKPHVMVVMNGKR